ncbi:MAG: exo-alpha-sialidase [Verrucomicrobia bacterium]|nr:exo-alpha-sialidase [Verrucomicrobiota bacterium]
MPLCHPDISSQRARPHGHLRVALAIWLGAGGLAAASAPRVDHVVPFYQFTQTLVASEDMEVRRYLAFPITLRLGGSELLIAYKRGFAHAFDAESSFDVLHYDIATQRARPQAPLFRPNNNFENAEFVRFANGDISCFVDNQQPWREPGSSEATRLGLIEFRSTDGGRTFKDLGKVGLVDGVEYGYVFEAITEGPMTWMLAMTFANLPGGKSIVPGRPRAGWVSVLRTDDNGRTWRSVKNLSETFQSPINESSFIPYPDGYLFSCRPYTDAHLLVVTDRDFNVRRKVDLVERHDFVGAAIGRPRVFAKDGRFYLMGRNRFKPSVAPILAAEYTRSRAPEQRIMLGLFRFDPETLAVDKHVVLDNAENQRVVDAYYATPFWQSRKGKTYFNVITYKSVFGRMPDIVRFEYEWDEVK